MKQRSFDCFPIVDCGKVIFYVSKYILKFTSE